VFNVLFWDNIKKKDVFFLSFDLNVLYLWSNLICFESIIKTNLKTILVMDDLKKIKEDIFSLKKKQRLSKITTSVSALFLAASVSYTVKLTLDKNQQEVVITKVINEKQKIVADLGLLKKNYDRVSIEKANVSEELEAERLKVIRFLEEVEKAEVNLTTYEERYRKLDNKISLLTRENQRLEKVNLALTREIDSLKAILSSDTERSRIASKQSEKTIIHVVNPKETKYAITKKYNISEEELVAQNPHIEKMLREGDTLRISLKENVNDLSIETENKAKLSISNAKVYEVSSEQKAKVKKARVSVSNVELSALQVDKTGKEIQTNKAKKTNKLKIDFTVAKNEIAEKETKNYYIQVINDKKQVLSQVGEVNFGSQKLAYTVMSSFDYDKSEIKISELIDVSGLEKGLYFVYIFDQNKMIGSKRITLE